jgi:hypothetical protein
VGFLLVHEIITIIIVFIPIDVDEVLTNFSDPFNSLLIVSFESFDWTVNLLVAQLLKVGMLGCLKTFHGADFFTFEEFLHQFTHFFLVKALILVLIKVLEHKLEAVLVDRLRWIK